MGHPLRPRGEPPLKVGTGAVGFGDSRSSEFAIAVVQSRRRHSAPDGQIPGTTPDKGVRRFMSHTGHQVTAPTLPASPRPATTNTYRRFKSWLDDPPF